MEAIIQQAYIISLAQDAGNLAGLDAGGDQIDLAFDRSAQSCGYIVGCILDRTFAPQIIV